MSKSIEYLLTDVSLMVGNGDDDATIRIHVENELDRELTPEDLTSIEERINLMRG